MDHNSQTVQAWCSELWSTNFANMASTPRPFCIGVHTRDFPIVPLRHAFYHDVHIPLCYWTPTPPPFRTRDLLLRVSIPLATVLCLNKCWRRSESMFIWVLVCWKMRRCCTNHMTDEEYKRLSRSLMTFPIWLTSSLMTLQDGRQWRHSDDAS